jgi:methyl-accepting chemotaxis protein
LLQVNKAVAEMDQVVQQNAASAQESASTAEEMSAHAKQMKDFVNELTALVEGRENGQSRETGKILLAKGDRKVQAALVPPAIKAHKLEGPFRAGGKNVKMEVAVPRSQEVNPEQVIPLEEGNFKAF